MKSERATSPSLSVLMYISPRSVSGSWPSVGPVLGLGGGDLGECREEMCGDTRHEARLLVSP